MSSAFNDVTELIVRGGIFSKFIILVLAVLSVLSWAIMLQRTRAFSRFERSNAEFWKRFMEFRRGRITGAELAGFCQGLRTPLATVFLWFHGEYLPAFLRSEVGHESSSLQLGMLERGVDRVGADQLVPLERPLGWLATFTTLSPFLGLLGTVWGIMGSFLQIARQGTGTLEAVGPGIAEALITTVAGLAVAIPSVVGYNSLARRSREQEQELTRLGSMLADYVSEETIRATSRSPV